MQDIQKYPTVTSLQIQQSDPGLEKDKKSIYSHPLYPLLALLLEQCEMATCNPDSQAPDTFEVDLQAYIQRNEGSEKMFCTDNKDLDSLIVKAIQVLRIHINELRKVNELCRDFCTRYISCLKTKIHQDSMFDDSEASSPAMSDRQSPNVIQGPGSAYNSPYSIPGTTHSRNYLDMRHGHRHQQHLIGQMHNLGHGCNSNIGQISVDCSDFMTGAASSPPMSRISIHEDLVNNNYLTSSSNSTAFGNLLDSSKQKRGVLPKKATQIMKQWLFQHLVHPYPTEDEKRQIANQTNLTLLQVNNWFINARRRILQPMLETSASPGKEKSNSGLLKTDKSDSVSESEETISGYIYSSSCGNRKKKAATNRPSNNRFWPASLAAAVNILSTQPPNNNNTATTSNTMGATYQNHSKEPPQVESSTQSRYHKRSKTNTSDVDSYQPPKIFNSSKVCYDSFTGDVRYKSPKIDTKSHSDTSTPQYTELSSPNNSKTNSLDGNDRMLAEPSSLQNMKSNSTTPDSKTIRKPDGISSYNSANHDTPSEILFPPSNFCQYVPSNSYANFIMPPSNSYLSNPAMFYNATFPRTDPNSMSSALFGIRNPNSHSFPIYDSGYSNYEHLIDKRLNMVSHINDFFATPHGFSRSCDDQKSGKTMLQYPHMDNPPALVDSLTESGPLNSYPYSQLESFPNFKAFHSKTNSN